MVRRHSLDAFSGASYNICCPKGAVAQLVERVVRNDEVRGSIPLRSTNFCLCGPVTSAIGLRRIGLSISKPQLRVASAMLTKGSLHGPSVLD
jgi:hypothetical protein